MPVKFKTSPAKAKSIEFPLLMERLAFSGIFLMLSPDTGFNIVTGDRLFHASSVYNMIPFTGSVKLENE